MSEEKTKHWVSIALSILGAAAASAVSLFAPDMVERFTQHTLGKGAQAVTNALIVGGGFAAATTFWAFARMFERLIQRLDHLSTQLTSVTQEVATQLDGTAVKVSARLSKDFRGELERHAGVEQESMIKLTSLATTLTGLSQVLTRHPRFVEPTQKFAQKLGEAIAVALQSVEPGVHGPRLAYSLGILKLLERAVVDLSNGGVHLSKQLRNELYVTVGETAQSSILRIEPMDRWPHGHGNDDEWSDSFATALERLGRQAHPTEKTFVLIKRDDDSQPMQTALSEYLTQHNWDVRFISLKDLQKHLQKSFGPVDYPRYAREVEGHHFVVDRQLDLIADLHALMPEPRGASVHGIFDRVQPPVKAVFFETGAEHQRSQNYVSTVIGLAQWGKPTFVEAFAADYDEERECLA